MISIAYVEQLSVIRKKTETIVHHRVGGRRGGVLGWVTELFTVFTKARWEWSEKDSVNLAYFAEKILSDFEGTVP